VETSPLDFLIIKFVIHIWLGPSSFTSLIIVFLNSGKLRNEVGPECARWEGFRNSRC